MYNFSFSPIITNILNRIFALAVIPDRNFFSGCILILPGKIWISFTINVEFDGTNNNFQNGGLCKSGRFARQDTC